MTGMTDDVERLKIPDGLMERPRQTAHQVLVNVPGGHGYFDRQVLAVEVVMNEEWWRGYAAALSAQLSPRAEVVEECARVAHRIVANNGADYEESDGAFLAAADIEKALRSLAPSHKEKDDV